jgi:hypothetical protein
MASSNTATISVRAFSAKKLEFYNHGLTKGNAGKLAYYFIYPLGFPNKTGTDLEPIA